MDSGATCHMIPYRNEFIHNTETLEEKGVDVVDGYTEPAKLSGTVMIQI